MANEIPGKGTVLQLSIASTFTTVAQVFDITPPSAKVETFKATDLTSGTIHKKRNTGYVDGGECTFEIFYDPQDTTHKALLALITTPTAANVAPSSWKVIYADAVSSPWTFQGNLISFDPKVVMADGVKATIKIEVTDTLTYPS